MFKKVKVDVAVTHNGVFHADDVFSAALLRIVSPGCIIVRTRDEKVMEAADVVFDVGGFHDGVRVFDHHQVDESLEQGPDGPKHAAFGLLAKWLIIEEEVLAALQKSLVWAIEAQDNGQDPAWGPNKGAWVSAFNPTWQEGQGEADAAFDAAVGMAETIIRREIASIKAEIAARDIVSAAVTGAEDPEIVTLPGPMPWQAEVVNNHPDVRFVIFPSGKQWNVQVVPLKLGAFGARKDLPQEWAGLKGQELAEVTGVPGAVFCHAGRFIAGWQTKEGALEAARLALK